MEKDKYGWDNDPYRDMEAPWLLYSVLSMLRALDHRIVTPQNISRRLSYMFYDKYKRKDEPRTE